MKCEIERMGNNLYVLIFFAFLKKVIKKLLTFCYWQDRKNPSSFPVVQDWHHLTVQRHVVAYKLYVGFSCKEVKVTEALSTLRVIEMK